VFRLLAKISALLFLPALVILAFSFISQKEIEEIIPRQKRTSEKGLYVTAPVAKTSKMFGYIKEQAKNSGLNTVVIDAKYDLEEPILKLVKERELTSNTLVSPNPWLSKLAAELNKEGFIVTVRLVVFKDDHLVIARPDLAVRIKGGGLYRDHKGGRWADPYSEEVRLYNELIAEIAAISGVDEIQFDYIRFPAEAGAHNAYYPFEVEGISRVETINSFLKGVRERVKKYNVSIGVDIFGVTAWQNKNDIENLGQDLKGMAKYIDVLSPMFYPSHFHSGYDGFENPGSHPYYFIKTGVKKTKELLSGEAVSIVPWLQGFNLRSPNFGPNYILEQVRACREEAIGGYLIWNARNDYTAAFSAHKKK
jgi:hypothetical protein